MKYEFNQTKFIKQILSNYSIKLFYQINFIETNLSFISSISFYQFHLRTLHFRTHIANFCTPLMMMAMATSHFPIVWIRHIGSCNQKSILKKQRKIFYGCYIQKLYSKL